MLTVHGGSLATRLFAVQLAVILGLTVIAVAVLWVDARSDVEREAAARSLAVAQTIALDPWVERAVSEPTPSTDLQPYAAAIMAETSIDFITIMALDGTRFTHRDPARIGQKFVGTIDQALAGKPFTETYTGTLGPSVRAVAPIMDSSNDVVALVAAGVTVSTTEVAFGARIGIVIAAAATTAGVAALAAWLLSRYLRRVTWGHGAEEIGRMLAYYEGVLHSIGDGLLLQDAVGRIVLYNASAAEFLGLPAAGIGPGPTAVGELRLNVAVATLLSDSGDLSDEILITGGRVLVIDRYPVASQQLAAPAGRRRSGGRGSRRTWSGRNAPRRRDRLSPTQTRIGTVTSIRDRTKLQELTGELQTVTTLSDAMRSQTHEFANRLHTILALIELNRAGEAAEITRSELALSQRLTDRLVRTVDEPVVLALLLGKSAQAAQQGVHLELDLPEDLHFGVLEPRDLITIVGNLIDNALEAAQGSEHPRVTVALLTLPTEPGLAGTRCRAAAAATESSRLVIRVSDSGAGPPINALDRLLEFGESTKSSFGRGIGLALVKHSVTRLNGTLSVSGSRFTVSLPILESAGSAGTGGRDPEDGCCDDPRGGDGG
jgi:two-component system CitB family sensor kinase